MLIRISVIHFLWNVSNVMDIYRALWILMIWCINSRASVATVLNMQPCVPSCLWVITLRPRQNCRHFADDISKSIFLMKMYEFRLRFDWCVVPKDPVNNIPPLVQIMAWRRPGDKPLFEPMMVSLLTHICVTRPQWVNGSKSILKHVTCNVCVNVDKEVMLGCDLRTNGITGTRVDLE